MGSLYSSICASLIAVGVGEAVASRECAKARRHVQLSALPHCFDGKFLDVSPRLAGPAAPGLMNDKHDCACWRRQPNAQRLLRLFGRRGRARGETYLAGGNAVQVPAAQHPLSP